MKITIALGFIILLLTALNGCYVRDPSYDRYYHGGPGRYDKGYDYNNRYRNYNYRDDNYRRGDRGAYDNDGRYRDGDGPYDHH